MVASAFLRTIAGVHHIKVPVSDLLASRDWYAQVLGFVPVLDFENADELLGVVIETESGVRS